MLPVSNSSDSNTEYLKPLIEATAASASRFRRVLIVMIIASILAFGAFWNARRGSWLNSRIDVALLGNEYLTLKDKVSRIESELTYGPSDPRMTALYEQKKELEGNVKSDKYEDAKAWLKYRGMQDREQLAESVKKLEQARVDSVLLIKIPFFGIVVDINDLGLLGGFTFVVILMWFRFSLWREYFNLISTFREAKTLEHLGFVYRSLAAQQVLTVPPALSEIPPIEKPWGKVVRVLYFLPVLVQVIILIYDIVSFKVGLSISRFNSYFGVLMSASFLYLSMILTSLCLQLSRHIDKEWEDTANTIRPSYPSNTMEVKSSLAAN